MPILVADALHAIDTLIERLDLATQDLVSTAARQVQNEARIRAAKLSGENAASIEIDAAKNSGPRYGMTGVPLGRYAWSRLVGPTTVYGRIREIGGPIPGRGKTMSHPYLRWWWNGRPVFKRRVYQHGKPYLRPAVENLERTYLGLATRKWGQAILSV